VCLPWLATLQLLLGQWYVGNPEMAAVVVFDCAEVLEEPLTRGMEEVDIARFTSDGISCQLALVVVVNGFEVQIPKMSWHAVKKFVDVGEHVSHHGLDHLAVLVDGNGLIV